MSVGSRRGAGLAASSTEQKKGLKTRRTDWDHFDAGK